MKQQWAKHEIEYLKENYVDKTVDDLSRIMVRSPASISGKARTLGLKKGYLNQHRRLKPKKVIVTELIDPNAGISLYDVGNGQCRFPLSTGANMRVCGEACEGTYCESHHEYTHVKTGDLYIGKKAMG